MPELFTLREAAALADISPEKVRTALEKKAVVSSRQRKTGKGIRHQFSAGDVLLLKVLAEFPFRLGKNDKGCLTQVFAHGKRRVAHWSLRGSNLLYRAGDVHLVVDCKPFRDVVNRNLSVFRAGHSRIVSSPHVSGGEPVFRGTRIPLRHVAALFRKKVAEREIAEDLPTLSKRDLAYARLIARIGQKPGRPKRPLLIQQELRAA